MQRFLTALAVATWLAFVSSFVPGAIAGEKLRIGLSLDQTGPYRELALMHQRAYELWRNEINQSGGILGRPIELIIIDDEGNADRAADIYDDLINRRHVDLVLAPYSSEITAKVAPVVDRAGYPLLAAGASSDTIWQQGYTHVFGMMATASRYSQGMLRLAIKGGISTVAIISAPDEFSEQAGKGTNKWARYLKIKVVHEETLITKGADMTEAMRNARAKHADLVVVAGHLDDAIAARKALADIAWKPRAFYATIGPALPVWSRDLGDLAEGALSTSLWEPLNSDDFPGASDFAERFRARYGVEPSYQAATAFAAGQILAEAITVAGGFERDKINKALSQLDTYSIQGRFAVDHSGMQIKRIEMIIQWQKGRKEIVWPPELRTADVIFGDDAP